MDQGRLSGIFYLYTTNGPKHNICSSPPKLFKPRRVGGRISHGVLNVPVPKVVLDQARVCPLIGQGEAAGVAEHVGMSGQGKARRFAIALDRNPSGFPAQRPASLTHEKRVRVGLHLGSIREPRLDSPQLVGPQWMGGG